MITIEDIQEHIVDIHDAIDIDEAMITSDVDDDNNPIVYPIEEQLAMYKKLVEEVHDSLWALSEGIDKGELPKTRFQSWEESEPVEFEYCPEDDSANCKEEK